jgi:hypothetical protein
MKFTFGTDPEFMIMKDGKYESAIGIVPKRAEDENGNNLPQDFYYDNVLAECSIDPGESKEETTTNIRNSLKKYAKLVSPHKLVPQAAQEYPKNQLRHADARRVGCRPEACCYIMKNVPMPEQEFIEGQLRTAGGHVHLGTKLISNDFEVLAAIRMMDLFVGIPSIFIDHDPTSATRKQLYGKAGRFRKTSYGAEYRSIGNFWLSSPKLVSIIYDLSDFVLEFLAADRYKELWDIDIASLTDPKIQSIKGLDKTQFHKCIGYDIGLMRDCIDNMDRTKGKQMMDFVSAYLPKSLMDAITTASVPKQFDMYKEWNIKA